MPRLALVALLTLGLAFSAGCGRPTEPGQVKEKASKNRMMGEDKGKDKSADKGKGGGKKGGGPVD
jgi:hypothetical protein